jgi:hypothetical protein
VRALGIDVGERRIGLAISDATRTRARPLKTIDVAGLRHCVERVAAEATRLAAEDDGLDDCRRLAGAARRLAEQQTTRVTAFIAG